MGNFMKINDYARLLRPHQFAKQLVVLLPLLAVATNLSRGLFLHSLAALLAFTLSAGFVYTLNDILDLQNDKLDSVRKLRPIASGKVDVAEGMLLSALFLLSSETLTYFLSFNKVPALALLNSYILLNIIYSFFKLKKHNLIGIFIVAFGFGIRFNYGAAFLKVKISWWALVLITELSLFMLSTKRYQQLHRKIQGSELAEETNFWLIAAVLFAAMFSAAYASFITSEEVVAVWGRTTLLFSTIPLSLGMVRFIEIGTHSERIMTEDATDAVVRDPLMLLTVVLYIGILLWGRVTHG